MSVPILVYALEVPAGGEKVPVYYDEDFAPPRVELTMAAIDPSALKEGSSKDSNKFVTLKLHRFTVESDDEDDDEDDDEEEDEEEDEEKDSGDHKKKDKLIAKFNGGPDEVEQEETFILATLEPGKLNQIPLNITVSDNEEIYLSATGSTPVFVTGNYSYAPTVDDGSDEEEFEEEEYDLSPNEDELKDLYEDEESGEEDELDDLNDGPKIEIIEEEEEDTVVVEEYESGEEESEEEEDAPKGKKRRGTDEDMDEVPELVQASAKEEIDLSSLSKNQRKKLAKKMRNDKGEAVPTGTTVEAAEKDKKGKKSVQFDKQLQHGPTGSGAPVKPQQKEDEQKSGPIAKDERKKQTLAGGLIVEDYEVGQGPNAKSGQRIGMRYIGKLQSGKVFDQNTKGTPFTFTLGRGEVIRGWDEGIKGMKAGGKRKLTVPPALAYGKKGVQGIPPNATLIFECKLVSLK